MGEHHTKHKRRMRVGGLLAGVVASAMVLSGCTLIGDGQEVLGILQAEAAQQEVLKAAIDELRSMPGVEEASSRFLPDGPQGDEADIEAVADADATAAELVTIAETARAAFASPELKSSVSKFTLTVGASVLRTASIHPSAAELAAEVTYWRAMEEAIGAELSVRLGGDGGSGQMREIMPAAEPGDDAAFTENLLEGSSKLLALEDEWDGPTFWVMPGMTATPGLPSAEALALLDGIRAEYPLSNPRAQSEGALLWWQGADQGLTVAYMQEELRDSDWPSVVALAQKVIAAAIPGSGFVYQTQSITDFVQYRFYLDECQTEVTAGADDHALVDALAAAGTPVPATGGAGFCAPE
jgi:hypothetical protein